MISDSSYQFYFLIRYHTICEEHEKCKGEYKEHIDKNQDKFLN